MKKHNESLNLSVHFFFLTRLRRFLGMFWRLIISRVKPNIIPSRAGFNRSYRDKEFVLLIQRSRFLDIPALDTEEQIPGYTSTGYKGVDSWIYQHWIQWSIFLDIPALDTREYIPGYTSTGSKEYIPRYTSTGYRGVYS